VRQASFVRAIADHVTVYVLLGDGNTKLTRFFVVSNSKIMAEVCQSPDWNTFRLIALESVKEYEDNWDILRA
jgi:hypothetical protein